MYKFNQNKINFLAKKNPYISVRINILIYFLDLFSLRNYSSYSPIIGMVFSIIL